MFALPASSCSPPWRTGWRRPRGTCRTRRCTTSSGLAPGSSKRPRFDTYLLLYSNRNQYSRHSFVHNTFEGIYFFIFLSMCMVIQCLYVLLGGIIWTGVISYGGNLIRSRIETITVGCFFLKLQPLFIIIIFNNSMRGKNQGKRKSVPYNFFF